MTQPPIELPGMWPEPVTVVLDGEDFVLPARPAVDWVRAVIENDPIAVFPGMLENPDDYDWIVEQLLADEAMAGKVEQVTQQVLTAVAGRPWWQADRLIQFAAVNWELLLGTLALHGASVDTMSLPAFLSAVYAWHVDRMDEKQRMRFDDELAKVPPGVVSTQTVETFDDGGASFMAAFGALSQAPSGD